MQERYDNSQNNLHECKDQVQSMHERIQNLQSDLGDADIRRSELETHSRQLVNQNIELDQTKKDLMQQILNLQRKSTLPG